MTENQRAPAAIERVWIVEIQADERTVLGNFTGPDAERLFLTLQPHLDRLEITSDVSEACGRRHTHEIGRHELGELALVPTARSGDPPRADLCQARHRCSNQNESRQSRENR